MPTLSWIGKDAVVNHHFQVPFYLLRDVPELACGDLIVQGDNLVALKALLPYYAGQVKRIYIDPPYNMGNESWAYNDNMNSPVISEWLGKVVGKEGEDCEIWASAMVGPTPMHWVVPPHSAKAGAERTSPEMTIPSKTSSRDPIDYASILLR